MVMDPTGADLVTLLTDPFAFYLGIEVCLVHKGQNLDSGDNKTGSLLFLFYCDHSKCYLASLIHMLSLFLRLSNSMIFMVFPCWLAATAITVSALFVSSCHIKMCSGVKNSSLGIANLHKMKLALLATQKREGQMFCYKMQVKYIA